MGTEPSGLGGGEVAYWLWDDGGREGGLGVGLVVALTHGLFVELLSFHKYSSP